MQDLLFELIRIGLGKDHCLSMTLSDKQWWQLYDLAGKHALTGVCLAGLQLLDSTNQRPPSELLFQWIGDSLEIENRNKLINKQSIEVQRKLRDAGIRSCLLKGQGNALLYGRIKPNLMLLRNPGDIDLWAEGGKESVIRYVETEMPTDDVNELHIQYSIFDDTEVEVHFTPTRLSNYFRNRKLQKWFSLEKERQMTHTVELEGVPIVMPTSDFNMVYQLIHIWRHFFGSGIGLRQLMDYYVLLEVGEVGEEEMEMAIHQIRQFGLERFASALMWVLGYIFHLERNRMILEPNERNGRFLLSEIMQMGNFGAYDSRFQIKSSDSHIVRYWSRIKSKRHFIGYFTSEYLWRPINILLYYIRQKRIRRMTKRYKKLTN